MKATREELAELLEQMEAECSRLRAENDALRIAAESAQVKNEFAGAVSPEALFDMYAR